ncbi:MAG: winged helix-turn-helix transcriptional regulator [Candidatus Heimdallarchaeota archaeon]|nr:winged helix-turn-helix transcriptional regulator [Candidatus Heimdallarchaeota archaeon]MDH5647506.1 winged helix-turn-helix transcriptional regulator [Candidatus Heimdallarchaeota archaeon]
MYNNFDETRIRLPEKAIPLLRYLEANGPKTQRELIESLNLPTRTVRYSIRRLLERGLIKKVPNLKDMRSVFYHISPEVADVEAVIAEEMRLASLS